MEKLMNFVLNGLKNIINTWIETWNICTEYNKVQKKLKDFCKKPNWLEKPDC